MLRDIKWLRLLFPRLASVGVLLGGCLKTFLKVHIDRGRETNCQYARRSNRSWMGRRTLREVSGRNACTSSRPQRRTRAGSRRTLSSTSWRNGLRTVQVSMDAWGARWRKSRLSFQAIDGRAMEYIPVVTTDRLFCVRVKISSEGGIAACKATGKKSKEEVLSA